MIRDIEASGKNPIFSWNRLALPSEKLIIIASTLIYLAIYTHTPISLQLYQTYDDALFIKLGQSIANGHWLGPFNQLTLAKGAGYPLFLALSSWLGASITLSQAIFYCLSTLAFALVIRKITGSKIVALAIFLLVLFNPNEFQDRILRESIYTSQTLAVLCLYWLALCANKQDKANRSWAILAGLMLGWFWITREEGIWIIPGLVVIFLLKFLEEHRKMLSHREIFVKSGFSALAFFFVILLLRCVNLLTYHAFIGVDIKDPNFVSAMQQLQRTHLGPDIPYVPVSKETRERLYQLSPLFAALKPTLDPATGKNPAIGSTCWIWATTCQDFSGGHLFWQIRDGAAAAGVYTSESEAQKYFRGLSNELRTICDKHEIPCYRASSVPMMPHLSGAQWSAIGESLNSAWNVILQKRGGGWVDAPASNGDEKALFDSKNFLNNPLSTPVITHRTVTLDGWYFERNGDWFKTEAATGTETEVTRLSSSDLAKIFPGAEQQRFHIKFQCTDKCRLSFVANNNVVYIYDPDSPALIGTVIHHGNAMIAFDGITVQESPRYSASAVMSFSRHAREALSIVYSCIVPFMLYLGILAMLTALVVSPRSFLLSPELQLALCIAMIVVSRVAILTLINISSFPAMTQSYFSPVLCLIPVWSVLSILGTIRVVGNRKRMFLDS